MSSFIKLHFGIPVRSSVECGGSITININSIQEYKQESLWEDGRPKAEYTRMKLTDGSVYNIFESVKRIDEKLEVQP